MVRKAQSGGKSAPAPDDNCVGLDPETLDFLGRARRLGPVEARRRLILAAIELGEALFNLTSDDHPDWLVAHILLESGRAQGIPTAEIEDIVGETCNLVVENYVGHRRTDFRRGEIPRRLESLTYPPSSGSSPKGQAWQDDTFHSLWDRGA